MSKMVILSHLATACVCVPATVYVAPKVHHAIVAHRTPTSHHAGVRHRAVGGSLKPVIQYVTAPCVPSAVDALAQIEDAPMSTRVEAIDVPRVLIPEGAPTRLPYSPVYAPGPEPIFRPVSRVPDVSTWGAMLIGFGGVGAVLRKKRRTGERVR